MRKRKIQILVQQLLATQKVTEPPVPVERIARAQGARVFLQSLEGNISGFLYRDSQQRVIGVNTHHPSTRQRFTLAHELAHLLLHDQNQIHVDHGFELRLRNDRSSQGVDRDEMEANLFAAELLMPRRLLKKDLGDLQTVEISDDKTIGRLAKRYGVSVQALMIRLTALGYLNPRSEVSLSS